MEREFWRQSLESHRLAVTGPSAHVYSRHLWPTCVVASSVAQRSSLGESKNLNHVVQLVMSSLSRQWWWVKLWGHEPFIDATRVDDRQDLMRRLLEGRRK
jgi:hypothetical protein